MTEKAKKCPICEEYNVWQGMCYSCEEYVDEQEEYLHDIGDVEHADYQSCSCEDYPCCGH
ncbi:MAG: hypothetical protein HN975_15950 [Anaerolineae bacterium]|jgi:hypothetical protein|nr:hypothetical protein [Anaerolineae bacterium]